MGVINKKHITAFREILLISIITFLFINIVSVGKSYFLEEVYIKNLVLDLMCDIAEAGGTREALVEAVSEIDTFKQRGVYCAAYVPDEASKNKFRIISERSPLFGPFDPLDNPDLNRDIRLQNRGKAIISREKTPDSPSHEVHIYFRKVFQDSDEPIIIVLGMSKFAVETDHEQGLKIGAWIIAVASVLIITASAIPMIKRKRGES